MRRVGGGDAAERARSCDGFHRAHGDGDWVASRFRLTASAIEIQSPSAPGRVIPLGNIATVEEIAPFDEDPATCEVHLDSGEMLQIVVQRSLLLRACSLLESTTPTTPGAAPPDVGRSTPARAIGARRPRAFLTAAFVLIALLGVEFERTAGDEQAVVPPVDAQPAPPSTEAPAEPPSAPTTGAGSAMPTSTTPMVPPTAPTTPRETTAPSSLPPPAPAAQEWTIAPLTGMAVPGESVRRPALVSKIDGARAAMPQVGMEYADIVYEVKIEGGSRYLAVWHSREPAVVGPHRSARTTDPDLLSMFGHSLFAYSGANRGVVDTLASTTWKTGVGPGEVPDAYFRDDQRPWPHNLFATTEVLRTRESPPEWPRPLFDYGAADDPIRGTPVVGFASDPGTRVEFRWDPALQGWRRQVWAQEHLHASGAPVAPTNVVVVESSYRISEADARSPEAISVGSGRAWLFHRGLVQEGTWTRSDRTEPWNLRDALGRPLNLAPGTTWVVLSEGEPELLPPT